MPVTLGELAGFLQAQVQGDPALVLTGVAPLDKADGRQLSFFANAKYASMNSALFIIIKPMRSSFFTPLASNAFARRLHRAFSAPKLSRAPDAPSTYASASGLR